jgi:hypothetical protein
MVFARAFGLICNLARCQLAPIRCSESQVAMATSVFPCTVVSFSLKYLGILLLITKLPKSVWQPLIDHAADRLPVWKGSLMNLSGRLALIMSMLSVIPIYLSIAMEIPPWVQKALEKIFKAFLWAGSDVVHGGKCLVAWGNVQRPLELGGFGIKNLRLFGSALRPRWLWLGCTDPTRSWGMMEVKEDRVTTAFFKASTFFILGDGLSALFWTDLWLEGQSIADIAPDLVGAVSNRRHTRRTVFSALQHDAWISDIIGACMLAVIMQYLDIYHRVEVIVLNSDMPDRLVWRWTTSSQYSLSSTYAVMFYGQSPVLRMLQCSTPRKCNFFLWLAILGRCWTSEGLQRHGLRDDGSCAFCSQEDESVDQLVGCVYNHEVWFITLHRCGWQELDPTQVDKLLSWWLTAG